MDPPPVTDDRQPIQRSWHRSLIDRSRPQIDTKNRDSDLMYATRMDSPDRAMPSQIHFAPQPEANEGYIPYYEVPEKLARKSRKTPGFALRPDSKTTERRPSDASSRVSGRSLYSLYPPPAKPLPAIPPASPSRRVPSRESCASSLDSARFSGSSGGASGTDWTSLRSPVRKAPPPFQTPDVPEEMKQEKAKTDMIYLRTFEADKKKPASIFYLDVSTTAGTLASKHGKNSIKIWSITDGVLQSVLKFSAYTEAQCRSREYLIQSHTILSEPSKLIAIATRFGTVLEIWNWADKKCIQSIDRADRWAANHMGSYETGWSTVAVYHGEANAISLYSLGEGKKPLGGLRKIDLQAADLPFLFQYPELAVSSTSPLLVAAAGPRPPKPGHPPPDRETLLVAWDIQDANNSLSQPHMVVRPWQHREIQTAIPCELVTYGSTVVSIWIPASFQVVAVPTPQGGETYNIRPVAVPNRYVLVWDLASNSTRTFRIPNTTSCISPNCRYVAYCNASKTSIGGRGYLAIIDVETGKEIWCWPDPEATAFESGPKAGFEQFEALSRVTELRFSADGRFLFVGDRDGQCCMYRVLE